MISKTLGATLLTAMIAAVVASGGVAAHGDAEEHGVLDYGMGYGMGPGMMGGQGVGPGMMGGYGMGPGMMGGQGMGPGMMGGYGMGHGMMGNQGMGHGMMGSQGMGHGMMGGQGMGHGMMGGQGMGHGMMGNQGMGPGMMGNQGMGPDMMAGGLDLSSEQRKQISRIQTTLRKQNWTLQGEIIDAQGALFELYADETPDAKKIGAVYGKIFDFRRQMIEAAIEAQIRQRAVLTEEQRKQLQQGRFGQSGGEHGHGQGTMPGEMGSKKLGG